MKLRVALLGSLLTIFSLVAPFFHAQAFGAACPRPQAQSSQQQPPPPPPPAQSQQNGQAQQNTQPAQQPAVKQKRVWTNDDVVALRTPADTYQVDKEARQAAEAEQAAKQAAEAKEPKQPALTVKLPNTAEETQKAIVEKEGQITGEQNGLERLLRELPDASDDQKADMQKEVDRLAADLPRIRTQLKALQDHLAKLTKPRSEAPTAPPPPQEPQ